MAKQGTRPRADERMKEKARRLLEKMHRTEQLNRTKQLDCPTMEYDAFTRAYDFFNERLFAGALPRCLITLQRKAGSAGYFSSKRFETRDEVSDTDEIALNPAVFKYRPDADILGTLVHEMAHLWQYHFGNPGRGRYHNAEWADKMEALGLMPSNTGMHGGKRTGQRMSHYVLPDGPYDTESRHLLASGFQLTWQSRENNKNGEPKGKNKVKYNCPDCGQNAWAKPGAVLDCGVCKRPLLGEVAPLAEPEAVLTT